jgi:hypothetical protein
LIFNKRSDLEGKHAFLSPSKYHWVNYTDQKLEARFISAMAARRGTRLHDFAQDAIDLGIKLPRTKTTMNMYVNDAIGYKMETEQPLYYSPNCFGHADTICFRNGVLRIHDLKTGITQTSFGQLEVYAAIFCLEYSIDPYDIQVLLRIYQNDEVREHEPYADNISVIMDKIVDFDAKVEAMKETVEW